MQLMEFYEHDQFQIQLELSMKKVYEGADLLALGCGV